VDGLYYDQVTSHLTGNPKSQANHLQEPARSNIIKISHKEFPNGYKITYSKNTPKESLTIRLPHDVREEAERLAEKHGVSLALLVEAGLKLLFKQEMEESQNIQKSNFMEKN
jgi:hypothetical protein